MRSEYENKFASLAYRLKVSISLIAISMVLARSLTAAESIGGEPFTIGPWRLGMTKEEVVSFGKYGPYERVESTGGVETRNAVVAGKNVNASFVFDTNGLKFIQVWKYEGPSYLFAKDAVIDLYELFVDCCGGAQIDSVAVQEPGGLNRTVLSAVLDRTLATSPSLKGATPGSAKSDILVVFDMTPIVQPGGSNLHCEWSYSSKSNSFYVFLFQDRLGESRSIRRSRIIVEQR